MGIFGDKMALESLQTRLAAVEERCEVLERQRKQLRLEWEETYDKVSHQMSRISRRVASSKSSNGELPTGEDIAENQLGADPISQSILRRRGMPRITK